jgi:hypothetical protein
MAGNNAPIFSKVGDIQGLGTVLTTAANDFTGTGVANAVVFLADTTNGGYVQRLRFKSRGTNTATAARIFIGTSPNSYLASQAATPAAPTGTPSITGGTLVSGTYFAKIVSVDAYGIESPLGTESASVSVTGPTGSIAWTWTATANTASYNIYVGPVTGGQVTKFTSSTNAFTQTTATNSSLYAGTSVKHAAPNFFYGEIAFPTVASSATVGTVDFDYPMNIALPPGYTIIVGLATTVTGGWEVTAIGGKY